MSTPFNKIFRKHMWRRIVLFVLFVEIIVISALFMQGGKIMGGRLGIMTAKMVNMVDIVLLQNNANMTQQMMALFNSDTFIDITLGSINNVSDPIPLYPFVHSFKRSFERLNSQKFELSYQANPPTIWIKKITPPYFSLSAPFVGHQFYTVTIISLLLINFSALFLLDNWFNKKIRLPLKHIASESIKLVNDHKAHKIEVPEDSIAEIVVLTDTLNTMHADIFLMIKEREIILAEVAHDTRTPLSRLRLAIELMENESEVLKESLRDDINEMGEILNQTMQLAHVNKALLEDWILGDINQLLTHIKHQYARASISLDLKLTELPLVRYKTISMTRLLYNVIDNSIKYGNGWVHISTRLEGNLPTLSIMNKIDGAYSNNKIDHYNEKSKANSPLRNNKLGLHIIERIAHINDLLITRRYYIDRETYEVNIIFPAIQ